MRVAKASRRVAQVLVGIYRIPPHIWEGILVGTLAPYLLVSALAGMLGGIGTLLVLLSFGFPVISFIILVVLPLAFATLRRMKRLHVLHAALIGCLIPATLLLATTAYTMLPVHSGSSYYSNGTWFITNGRLTADGFVSLFVWRPLAVTPVGLFGALMGWFAAFGFRASVNRETLMTGRDAIGGPSA